MKVFLVSILKFGLRIIYAPLKLLKTKNRIVYLSRQRNTKDEDFTLLENEIKRLSPDTEQVFRLKMIDNGFVSKIKYCFYVIGDMYYLATSKVAILDTYSITASCLKHKKSLKIVQIWHALGAVKKFGYQAFGTKEGRDEKLSRAMCMHKNYDFVIAPSDATALIYKEAFNTESSHIKICPMPRVDFITDGNAYCSEMLKTEFNNEDGYALIVKAHPLSKMHLDEKYTAKGDFTTFELMKIADIIITDYSACAYEASLLMKPLYFFVPDFDEYVKDRGLNVDVRKELPGAVFYDAESLSDAVRSDHYDFNELYSFKNKYIKLTDEKATTLLASFIVKLLGE